MTGRGPSRLYQMLQGLVYQLSHRSLQTHVTPSPFRQCPRRRYAPFTLDSFFRESRFRKSLLKVTFQCECMWMCSLSKVKLSKVDFRKQLSKETFQCEWGLSVHRVYVISFVRSFVPPDRSCYHDISWTAWAVSMKLAAPTDYLIGFWRSKVKVIAKASTSTLGRWSQSSNFVETPAPCGWCC